MNEALQAIVVLSSRELCCCLEIALTELRRLIACPSVGLSPMWRIIASLRKPSGQKNDVRCEYTRGAPEPSMLQIPIRI